MTTCARCGAEVAGRTDRAFCSNACRQALYRARRRAERIDGQFWHALERIFEIIGDSRNAHAVRSRNASGKP